mmetsp:Transcript_1970/g.2633  ORF Transcript_1970/g.2633 Transcript_1970/m.2633 type:complete len:150 (-) Transcript_1970:32-481(-)
MPTYSGSCNCGAVKFEWECKEKAMMAAICHCRMCRQTSGHSAPHLIGILRTELKWSGDEMGEYVAEENNPSKMFFRFCKKCGAGVCQAPTEQPFTAIYAQRFDWANSKTPVMPDVFKPDFHCNFENACLTDVWNDSLDKWKVWPGGEKL